MVKKLAFFVSDYKNHYKGQYIRPIMAKEWVGKCNSCNKWRTNFDTYKSATRRDEEGKPADFVLVSGICSAPIQKKCCANGCPHCGGTGMHPTPSPPLTHIERAEILIEIQEQEAANYELEQMQILYGKDYR